MSIAQEEIFGPVLSLIGYADDDDAVRIANDTVYGLPGLYFGWGSRKGPSGRAPDSDRKHPLEWSAGGQQVTFRGL
ncbi:MAG: hypothetical protein CM1200mP9_05500 [Gammaproteobacteria bacterium]|nr:MAG: hypothetical protein CM1200mP9_05500 [Gammaproteobacteria bacterium]